MPVYAHYDNVTTTQEWLVLHTPIQGGLLSGKGKNEQADHRLLAYRLLASDTVQ